MFKKVLALIFSLSLIITSAGCGEEKTDSSFSGMQTGRYIEEQISLQDDVDNIDKLFVHNNKISFIDIYEKKLYTQNEDKNDFTPEEIPSINELGEDTDIFNIALSEKNEYFIQYYIHDQQDNIIAQYAYISSDGKLSKIDLDIKLDIAYFNFDDRGRLFAYDFSGNVYEINCENGSQELLFSTDGNPVSFDVAMGNIIVVNSTGITLYNIEKKQIDTPDVLKKFIKDHNLNTFSSNNDNTICDFCDGKDNSIYIICSEGLFRYILGGNQVEQLLDGLSYHIGSPAYNIRSVIMESDDSILVSYDERSIMRYHYDSSALNKIDSEINIYSLTNNDTLELIITEYKIKNPNVKVNYEIGMDKNSGITYEDAVKNLNTEILSGNSPDIIMLDNMDTENYIQKHMLEDLTDYQNRINCNNALLDNVAKQYTDNQIYSMICKFRLPVVIAEKENISSADNLSSIADKICDIHKQYPDEHITRFFTENDVLENAIDLMGNQLITDNKIDTEVLKQMLEDCCEIYKCEKEATTDEEINSYKVDNVSDVNPVDHWYYNACGKGAGILVHTAKIALGTTGSFPMDINIITSLNDINPDITYQYGFSDNKNTFIPECKLGICSSGKNKDNAVDFLQTAFSEAVQDVDLYNGFPVSISSLQKYYNSMNTKRPMRIAINSAGGEIQCFTAEWMDENEIKSFKQTIEKLDTPVILDTLFKSIIIDTGTKYLNGSITIDEAVKDITSKIDLRMQE